MPRKKKSEMTLHERIDSVMKGESWEFAEEFATEVLARCFALHAYARKDGEQWYEDTIRKIAYRADEWAHEPGHPFILAMASVGNKIEKAGGLKEYYEQSRKEN